MILHGNSRSRARDLAIHLMRDDENDHVEVHQVRGFMSDDLFEALQEADALSRGTRCTKFLFSLSLSPPKNANVTAEEFEKAIEKVERSLGLENQPRAIVFHEKGDNRDRHAHVVWSRIDASEMKAVPLPYNRMRLREVSRELFVEHGWNMPRGLIDRSERNPLNYSFEQYQQAKRNETSAADLKARMLDAWASSDSFTAFKAALRDKGLRLAKGDRRGFVAVDTDGEVYSLTKWLGVKTKDVRERMGRQTELASVNQTKAAIAQDMLEKLGEHSEELKRKKERERLDRSHQRSVIVQRQRAERAFALKVIEDRQVAEVSARQAKFKTGLKGVWDWMRGENKRIKAENEAEGVKAFERDRVEREALIVKQREQRLWLSERQRQQTGKLRDQHAQVTEDKKRYSEMKEITRDEEREAFKQSRVKQQSRPRRRRGVDHDPSL